MLGLEIDLFSGSKAHVLKDIIERCFSPFLSRISLNNPSLGHSVTELVEENQRHAQERTECVGLLLVSLSQ